MLIIHSPATGACLLALTLTTSPPPAVSRSRFSDVMLCTQGGTGSFDIDTWRRVTSWDRMTTFERMQLLRGLLDGDLCTEDANHVAWRGLGYRVSADGGLRDSDGSPCSVPPDVLSSPGILKQLEAQLPLEDEDELEMLDTLVESLNGEELTRALVAEGDAAFLARRTLVRWLYLTQPALGLF